MGWLIQTLVGPSTNATNSEGGVGCWGGNYIPAMDFFIASGAVIPIEVGR